MSNSNFKTAELEIVVPTYNRPVCISDMMEKYAEYLSRGLDFSVSVWDSSTDDETEKIMRGYISERVRYIRKPSDTDVDEKTMVAMKNAVGEYVCLCGDGMTIKIDRVADIIRNNRGTELITLYDTSMYGKQWNKLFGKNKSQISYDNKEQYFIDNFWLNILYGATVCRRELIESIDIGFILETFKGTNFIYPSTLLMYANGPYVAVKSDYAIRNKGKATSGWMEKKQAMQIWTHNICVALDKFSNSIAPDVLCAILHNIGKYTTFFVPRGLILFRETDNFNLKLLKKYKPYFKRVKACSMFTAYLIALTPKWVCKAIHKIYRKLKGSDKKEIYA